MAFFCRNFTQAHPLLYLIATLTVRFHLALEQSSRVGNLSSYFLPYFSMAVRGVGDFLKHLFLFQSLGKENLF